MGLFDKVKAMKNAITGGAAKVYVDTPNITFGEPFEVTIRAVADDAPVKYDRIYLLVHGVESVEVPDSDLEYDYDGDLERTHETVRASVNTLELDITVAEAGELDANEQAEWSIEVELPGDASAPYDGHYATHYYQVFAALDCFGNDPDSGWVQLQIEY